MDVLLSCTCYCLPVTDPDPGAALALVPPTLSRATDPTGDDESRSPYMDCGIIGFCRSFPRVGVCTSPNVCMLCWP